MAAKSLLAAIEGTGRTDGDGVDGLHQVPRHCKDAAQGVMSIYGLTADIHDLINAPRQQTIFFRESMWDKFRVIEVD